MTLIAGFVVQDGILLCADTMFSDGITKEYRSKMTITSRKGSQVVFALAGNSNIANLAVDDCSSAITALSAESFSAETVKETVGCVVRRVVSDHIDSRPWEERERLRFALLFAVVIRGEKPKLFSIDETAPASVARYECKGCGRQLGMHIAGSGYHRTMTIDQAAMLAVHTVAAAKKIVHGVGGRAELALIFGDRCTLFEYDIERLERQADEYQSRAEALLLGIGNSHLTKEEFNEQIRSFVKYACKMRRGLEDSHSSFRELVARLDAKT